MVVGDTAIDFLTTSKEVRITGMAFPVIETGTGGFFSRTDGPETIMSGLKQLILTTKGERAMMPNFGTNLRRFVFEQYDAGLVKDIREDILSTLSIYAPNIITTKLSVTPDLRIGQEDKNVIYIRLYFQIRGDLLSKYVLDLIV